MAGTSSREVSRHLNTLFHCGATGQISDAELLERFVAGRDEAAEAAFAALVERHGVMVLGVCRRVLGNRDEAEDAFQATFLVLARKAAAIARREQLASWLHGVARHAALDAGPAQPARKRGRNGWVRATRGTTRPDSGERAACHPGRRAGSPARTPSGRDRALRAGRAVAPGRRAFALAFRKERFRAGSPGQSRRLRDRLTRRGFALSAAALASVLTQDAHAVLLPPVLVDSTIRVATLVAAGSSLAGVVSTSVATLTEGVLKAMLLAKLKFAFLGLVTLAVVSTSVGVVAQTAPDRTAEQRSAQGGRTEAGQAAGGSGWNGPHIVTAVDVTPGVDAAPAVARMPHCRPRRALPSLPPFRRYPTGTIGSGRSRSLPLRPTSSRLLRRQCRSLARTSRCHSNIAFGQLEQPIE